MTDKEEYKPEIVFIPGLVGVTHDPKVLLAWASAALPRRARNFNAHIHGVVSRVSDYIPSTDNLRRFIGAACGIELVLPPIVKFTLDGMDPPEMEGEGDDADPVIKVEDISDRLHRCLLGSLESYGAPTDSLELNARLQPVYGKTVGYREYLLQNARFCGFSTSEEPLSEEQHTMLFGGKYTAPPYPGPYRLHPVLELLTVWEYLDKNRLVHLLANYVVFEEWETSTREAKEKNAPKIEVVSIAAPLRTQVPDMRPQDPRAAMQAAMMQRGQ